MAAGASLDLTKDPLLALAFAAMLLAYVRDRSEQAALAGSSSLAVLSQLLQVFPAPSRSSLPASLAFSRKTRKPGHTGASCMLVSVAACCAGEGGCSAAAGP